MSTKGRMRGMASGVDTNNRNRITVGLNVGVFTNAAYFGVASVAIPLVLVSKGFDKLEIVVFFIVGSLTAGILNSSVGPYFRRRGFPWWGVSIPTAAGAVGVLGLFWASSLLSVVVFSAALGCLTLVFPFYIGLDHTRREHDDARAVAKLRTLFVSGYVAGLGLFALIQIVLPSDTHSLPLLTAALIVGVNLAASFSIRGSKKGGANREHAAPTVSQAGVPISRVTAVIAAAAILALVAADTLRAVYLPILLINHGFTAAFISGVVLACVLAEIPLLPVLGRASERFGNEWVLTFVCIAGAVSFAAFAVSRDPVVLVLSQVVYAVFAAGFQSIGMVHMGNRIRGGLAMGASIYVVLVQAGAVLGVALPLAIPGYSGGIFIIAMMLCILGGALALVRSPPSKVRPCSALRPHR